MTLEQLRIFVAVAYIEHFTRAAERLKISQSAVSAAVASLETELQVLLFDRARRHVELTAAGNVFLAEAEAIIARVDLALRRLEDLSELRIGRLAIGASQTVANYWLPPILNSFHDRFPGVTIDLLHGNSTEVEKRVLRGQVDIGIVEQVPNDATLDAETLASDTLYAVVGQKHDWFDRQSVEWADLMQTSWILREPGSGTRALFEAALTEHGISPESLPVSLILRSGEAVRNAVTSGACAAVISELVADVALTAGKLRRIESISIQRNFVALTLPGRGQTRATGAFLDHLRATKCVKAGSKQSRPALRSIEKSDSLNLRRA